MNKKLVTLAIHKKEKANVLKNLLEQKGIPVILEEMGTRISDNDVAAGYFVKIDEKDVNNALIIVEANNLFRYNDAQTHLIDDGRRRILVAVDFSEFSIQACGAAFDLAKQFDAKVKILNILPNMLYPSFIPFADSLKQPEDVSVLDRARKQMLNLCNEIDSKISEGKFPSVNYSYSLREGIVEEEIENFIKEYKPILLVLGTKGLDNNQTNVLGSVTADIIEITSIPVLAVPLHSSVKSISDINHVAFLTNIDKRDLASFDSLVQFMKPYPNVKITLVHVNYNSKGGRFNENELLKMQQYFQEQYPDLNIALEIIDSTDVVGAVSDFVEKQNVTVLSLNTRKRNILGRIFMPSMSRKILPNLNTALLVLRG